MDDIEDILADTQTKLVKACEAIRKQDIEDISERLDVCVHEMEMQYAGVRGGVAVPEDGKGVEYLNGYVAGIEAARKEVKDQECYT